MDNESSSSGSGKPSAFFTRFSAYHADRHARSNQLCRDYFDFCETIRAEMETLHRAYNDLADDDMKHTLARIDQVMKKIGENCKEGKKSAADFLREAEAPGAAGKLSAELALQANLRTIPNFVQMAESLERVLNHSIEDVKRINRDGATGDKKLACLTWIDAAQAAMIAVHNEIGAMNASLTVAQGPQTQR